MFELTPRRALIVRISSNRAVRSLRHYGLVRYVSRRMHYVVLYVDQEKIPEITARLKKLRAVRSIELSYRPDLDPTLTDLEETGLYRLHDEDDQE
ncbi:YlbG family protein [Limosilactobacillus sp.]|uniref:YlbG family protein n=1 Tax=Limosilactobacillus sp. TaxID=2773925 RepID=UPI003F00B056